MDIVDRLVAYKDYTGLTNSQFADRAGIPRPTLSQFLNGRNKRLSDDFTSKLHSAYPDLNVMWLLFGEGDMVADANNGFSEGKIGANPPSLPLYPDDNQDDNQGDPEHYGLSDNQTIRENTAERSGRTTVTTQLDGTMACDFEDPVYYGSRPSRQQPAPTPYPRGNAKDFGSVPQGGQAAGYDSASRPTIPHVPTDPTKHIRSIVILYSDSSYEIFSPGSK